MRLVLASASPRRADLLRAAGYEFDVVPADVDERPHPGEAPREYVARVAADKATTVACRNPGHLVLGADTAVVVDGTTMGKPGDARDARLMLAALSGRTHDVLTGLSVRIDRRAVTAVETTIVRFMLLAEQDIDWYVASGEWEGKAGGYAIQGLASRFVDRLDGSYSNVVGLPVATVGRLLRGLGFGG